jgi:hypothetical protein
MENRPTPSNIATAPLTAIAASDDTGTPPSAINTLPLGEIAARDGRVRRCLKASFDRVRTRRALVGAPQP